MIVKIERHNNEQDWWMLDNISKISCSSKRHHTKIFTPSVLGEDTDIQILDHEPTCNCDDNSGCKNCIKYYRFICRTKEHYEFSIAFDTIAYICNDEGKTIEKVVANYANQNK